MGAHVILRTITSKNLIIGTFSEHLTFRFASQVAGSYLRKWSKFLSEWCAIKLCIEHKVAKGDSNAAT